MIDANSQFFAILTNVGMAKQANADALGIPWKITEMGVGDANNTDPIPNASQTTLINEWRRRPLNQLKIDPINPAVLIAEQIIPADEGGKWIREIGLYDADGDLVAVANCAPSFKPILSQGSGRTQIVRMNFIVTSTGNITLKIDPAIVLASRAYVDAAILEVLPKNKTPGEWTRVKTNDHGIVVSGDNPSTLAGMGITDSYTKAQVEAMIAQASALPVGTQVSFPVNKIPPGFLERDGSVKSIALYPDLAAFLGGAFNKGDEGAGNFRLPESRGEFERGWDHGRGIDIGREVGTYQADDFKSHNHPPLNGRPGFQSNEYPAIQTYHGTSSTALPSYSGESVQMATTGARGGIETRGRNVAVVMCIKAWNAPINQGNIDIAALLAIIEQLQVNGPVAGEVRNAKMTIAAASATATFTADEVVVGDGVTRRSYRLAAFNKTINLGITGVGGMDTGTAPASGHVALYAIFNPSSGLAGILAANATAGVAPNIYAGANMPAGYTASALIGAWPTNPSKQFVIGHLVDREVHLSYVNVLDTAVQKATFTALSLAGAIPPNARKVTVLVNISSSVGSGGVLDTAGSPLGIGVKNLNFTSTATGQWGLQAMHENIPIITPQTIYYIATNSAGTSGFSIFVTSYTF